MEIFHKGVSAERGAFVKIIGKEGGEPCQGQVFEIDIWV